MPQLLKLVKKRDSIFVTTNHPGYDELKGGDFGMIYLLKATSSHYSHLIIEFFWTGHHEMLNGWIRICGNHIKGIW